MAPVFAAIGTAVGAPTASATAVGALVSAVTVGTGVTIAGQLQAAQAAAAQAEGQQALAEFNAKVQEQEARTREAQAQFRQQRQVKEAARISSSLLAGIGKAGVVPGEGAPLFIEAEQAEESELENLLIGFEGQIGAARARSQAELDRLQGRIAGRRAGFARTAGFIGAGTTLLTGFERGASAVLASRR